MLDTDTKRRIDTARDILVGKVPDPKSQVEQITIALIYKFMDDMDIEAKELGGERSFFTGEFEKYAWSNLMTPGMGGHDVLNLYSEGITKMNENAGIPLLFRDIFKNAYLPYRDPETLKSFLKIIDDFEYDHSERLGDAFEYLLSVLGSQGDAGQFRTPRHIIDFMVEVMDPKKDETILDPACGTAGFLISSYKHILKSNAKDDKPGAGLTPDERAQLAENIKGYDISPDMVRLSLVNLYLHGFTDPHIYEYDTLTSEDRWNEYANVTLANPPFMSPKGGIKPHKRFSVQSKRSEVLFVDYMAEHLTPNGRAAIIVPEGIIFQSQNAHKQLRKMLIEEYLFAVVSLPAGVFKPYSGVKTSILLMDKTLAKKSDSIMFVKIENDGFDLGAQRQKIEKNDLPDAAKLIVDYTSRIVNGEEFDAENLDNVLVVAKEKIGENGDWNLSGERYRENGDLRISNYEMVELGDVTELIGGGTPSRKQEEFWKDGTIKWISSKYFDNKGNIIGYELITEKAVEESSTKIIPKQSTILITRVSVGKSAFAVDDYAINQDLTGVITKDETVLYPKYLFHLSTVLAKTIEENAQGIGVRGVTRDFVSKLKIPLPPLEIQKEIVAEIEGYQKIIDGARAVVDNYKPHIQIDPEWGMVELGEVCNIKTGKLNANAAVKDGSYPFFTCSKEVFKIDNYAFDCEAVLLSGNNATGNFDVKYYNGKFNAYQRTYIITINNNYISKMTYGILKYILNDNLIDLKQKSIGGLTRYLTLGMITSIKLSCPSLEIQNHIVAQIEKEQALVNANKELITIFEQKIKDKIASVWGE